MSEDRNQTQEEALNALWRAGEELADKQFKLREYRGFVDDLIVEAAELGAPKAEISRLSGLSRQTVYSVLLRARVGRS